MVEDRSAARRIGDALGERGETLAVAESCTGGLLGSTVTGVAGSSDYFLGGVIAYTNQTKRQLLAISRESLEHHGAVSDPVASAMARHVRDETDADWGVSTTGYAGSAGDDATVRAGTVFVGIAYAGGDGTDPYAVVERDRFDGTRAEVKTQFVERALTAALAEIESVA